MAAAWAVSTVLLSFTALYDATPVLHGNTALINGTASCHCTTVVNAVPQLRH
jgi:hypothetical protein